MTTIASMRSRRTPSIRITTEVYRHYQETIARHPPETFAILGGYLGARYGRQVKQQYIRWFVIAVGFSLAAWYFYQQFFAPPKH